MKRKNVVFKTYNQKQAMLLPPSLEELIPEKHMVRVINEVLEKMNLEGIYSTYKGGGTSSYDPKMLMKIMTYAYATKVYSGREIAKVVRENIHFMWLSGGNRPDFRTINRFRSERLKGKIQEIFTEVLEYLIEENYIKYEKYFLDGTKVEANANKYSYVWSKNTKRYKKQLQEKVKHLFDEIEKINQTEDEMYGERDLEEMGEESEVTSEGIEKLAERMSEKLKEKPEDQGLKKKLKKVEDEYIPRMKRYEKEEKILGGRNSFSKTDHDAIFMRTKDDPMRSGYLKPGFNIQMGTEDQYIVGFSIHQEAGDSTTLGAHIEQMLKNHGKIPGIWVTDAGYGSEENYEKLKGLGVEGYVKYNTFYQETRKRKKIPEKEKYYARNFKRDEENDWFICPEGKKLIFEKESESVTKNGFRSKRRAYFCHDCQGCPVMELCTKSKYGRQIHYSESLSAYRKEAFYKLTSTRGKKLSSRRMAEPEAVFGLIKWNKKFRRFHLRGLQKVEVEWGLLSIAHNLQKIAG